MGIRSGAADGWAAKAKRRTGNLSDGDKRSGANAQAADGRVAHGALVEHERRHRQCAHAARQNHARNDSSPPRPASASARQNGALPLKHVPESSGYGEEKCGRLPRVALFLCCTCERAFMAETHRRELQQ